MHAFVCKFVCASVCATKAFVCVCAKVQCVYVYATTAIDLVAIRAWRIAFDT